MDGLGSVMRIVTTGAAGGSGLCAAQVFGARQFVAGIIDHFIRTHFGCRVGAQFINLAWKNYHNKDQEGFQQEGGKRSSVGENTVRGFAGQARTGAGEGGADGGDEVLPPRRPLDQELGRIVQMTKLDGVFELECIGH